MFELFVTGTTLPDAYHKALSALHKNNAELPCPDYNTNQKEAAMTMHVETPLAEPMISKLFIGDPRSLEQLPPGNAGWDPGLRGRARQLGIHLPSAHERSDPLGHRGTAAQPGFATGGRQHPQRGGHADRLASLFTEHTLPHPRRKAALQGPVPLQRRDEGRVHERLRSHHAAKAHRRNARRRRRHVYTPRQQLSRL